MRNATLQKLPNGTYLWTERGKYYKTLKGFRLAIQREDKIRAKNHNIATTILTIFG